jgi:hypothetical protein
MAFKTIGKAAVGDRKLHCGELAWAVESSFEKVLRFDGKQLRRNGLRRLLRTAAGVGAKTLFGGKLRSSRR